MIKSKSFQKNMFFSVGTVFVLFALCFSIYQYRREKEYKYEMMHSLRREGLLNRKTFMAYIAKHNYEGMRVSVIDSTGRVVMDSYENNTKGLENHLKRHEVTKLIRFSCYWAKK